MHLANTALLAPLFLFQWLWFSSCRFLGQTDWVAVLPWLGVSHETINQKREPELGLRKCWLDLKRWMDASYLCCFPDMYNYDGDIWIVQFRSTENTRLAIYELRFQATAKKNKRAYWMQDYYFFQMTPSQLPFCTGEIQKITLHMVAFALTETLALSSSLHSGLPLI